MSSSPFPDRTQSSEVELGTLLRPKFDANGLIPCITVEAVSNEVLMFAFMNAEALRHTIDSGKATYYSRSRGKLWIKGEESGHVQLVKELRVDCDQDVILLKVTVAGGASCHNGYQSCFYRQLADPQSLRLEFTSERVFDPASVYKK